MKNYMVLIASFLLAINSSAGASHNLAHDINFKVAPFVGFATGFAVNLVAPSDNRTTTNALTASFLGLSYMAGKKEVLKHIPQSVRVAYDETVAIPAAGAGYIAGLVVGMAMRKSLVYGFNKMYNGLSAVCTFIKNDW